MSDGISDGVDAQPGPVSGAPDVASDTVASPTPLRARRPNRWERPRPPHDWRWVVGGIGKALVTVGLLMFAFVGYQLWGTGIQAAQAQNRLEDRFDEVLSSTTLAGTTTTIDAPVTAPATSPTTGPPETSAPPALQPVAEPGEPVARLVIPDIDVDLIVVEGVGRSELQQGPGHFPETPMPGQLGNSAIAGHRTTFGAPFYDVDHLEPGDDIVVTTAAGTFTYSVTGQQIVRPSDYADVIPTVDAAKATLTLTSCHPIRSAAKRIVITAELDPARSAPATAPGTPGTVPDVTTPPTTTGVIPGDDVDNPDGAVPDAVAVASTNHDAFGDGWFSDPGAWPHVALWGALLVAVSVGALALMRRTRRYWPGILAGFVPFVVVLYFWFENVNRLLPPNL